MPSSQKWRMAMNIDRISWHVVSDFLHSGCAKWTGKDCCDNPLLTLYHSRLDTKASYGSTQFLGCLYLLELAEGNVAYCPPGKENFFYDSRNRGFTLLYDCHIASLSSEYSFGEELHFLQLLVDNVGRPPSPPLSNPSLEEEKSLSNALKRVQPQCLLKTVYFSSVRRLYSRFVGTIPVGLATSLSIRLKNPKPSTGLISLLSWTR